MGMQTRKKLLRASSVTSKDMLCAMFDAGGEGEGAKVHFSLV